MEPFVATFHLDVAVGVKLAMSERGDRPVGTERWALATSPVLRASAARSRPPA